MKIKVVMKDPDTLNEAIREAAEKEMASIADLSADEREAMIERREEEAREIAAKWFRYGEYLAVEIDTETKTVAVLEAGSVT